MEKDSTATPILKLVSSRQELVLRPLSGRRKIADAKHAFNSRINLNDGCLELNSRVDIDDGFFKLEPNNPGIATPETRTRVHQVISNDIFLKIFMSLSGAWEQKWLSQDQVIEFCSRYPYWSRQKGCVASFLCKNNEMKPVDENHPDSDLFVIVVKVSSNGLHTMISYRGIISICPTECCHRVISPRNPYLA